MSSGRVNSRLDNGCLQLGQLGTATKSVLSNNVLKQVLQKECLQIVFAIMVFFVNVLRQSEQSVRSLSLMFR